jgi:hypothetical protein
LIDSDLRLWYDEPVLKNATTEYFKVPSGAHVAGRENRESGVNPERTAAVNAETALVDESQSLGNREGRACVTGKSSVRVSQKTCFDVLSPPTGRGRNERMGGGKL